MRIWTMISSKWSEWIIWGKSHHCIRYMRSSGEHEAVAGSALPASDSSIGKEQHYVSSMENMLWNNSGYILSLRSPASHMETVVVGFKI